MDRDQCRVVVWRRGAPPIAPQPKAMPQPKAKVAPQPKAKAAPQLVLHTMTLTEKFNAILKHLKKKGAVLDGDLVVLKDFLKVFRLANHHTLRYLKGRSCWKLGEGRGKNLVEHTDWDYKSGRRGGGQGQGHPHVKAGVLKDIVGKYYNNRQIHLD